MSILKKTLLAGFAAVTMATAGAPIMASEAEAGYRHGHHNHYNYGYKRHYKRHYNNYYYNCFYKKVWRTDYYGNHYLKRIKICR